MAHLVVDPQLPETPPRGGTHTSSRDRTTALLLDEIEALARELPWFNLFCTYTRCPHDQRAGYRRRIDATMLTEVFETHEHALPTATYYVAGRPVCQADVRHLL